MTQSMPDNLIIPEQGGVLPTAKTFPSEDDWKDVDGFLKRVEEVPTLAPRNMYEQIVLVTNGGSTRTYFYEPIAASWLYTQLS